MTSDLRGEGAGAGCSLHGCLSRRPSAGAVFIRDKRWLWCLGNRRRNGLTWSKLVGVGDRGMLHREEADCYAVEKTDTREGKDTYGLA